MRRMHVSDGRMRSHTQAVSIRVAALISALLLSLLCSLFYNFWVYEVERIQIEEGTWQSRLTGELDQDDLKRIKTYAKTVSAEINQERSKEGKTTVDLSFERIRTVFSDTEKIAELVNVPKENIEYHYSLLNLFLIRSTQDTAPRLLFPFMLAVTFLACATLVLMIHHSFAVTMQTRIHQFGILSSIGATPRQIRAGLLREALGVCMLPGAAGNLLGIAGSMWVIDRTNTLAAETAGRHEAVWSYHPAVFFLTVGVTFVTVWISAWIPARKMSKMTPLEAIHNTKEFSLKKKKRCTVLHILFGIEGELAGNALKAQKKALRTASLSLIFSFLAFTLTMCFFTLTGISQRMTYFERYQDAWDLMAEIPDGEMEAFEGLERLQALPNVQSCTAYVRTESGCLISEEDLSEELTAIGGFGKEAEKYGKNTKNGWMVHAPLIILDDHSFLNYCAQLGIPAQLDGVVIRNQIEDFTDPNFRDRASWPYLKGTKDTAVLCRLDGQEVNGKDSVEILVLAYTQEEPPLREEYGKVDFFELVHFVPLSLWEEIREYAGKDTDGFLLRILAQDDSPEALQDLQEKAEAVLHGQYETYQIENRVQDKYNNEKMMHGMMVVLGGFCVLLALIGIGSVFSNTLGFVHQRKREVARYLSIGMTPNGLKKMFCIEACVLAGKPLLITIPITALMVGLMLKLSYLDPGIFLPEAPVMPVILFFLCILFAVALAYWLGWRRLNKISLADALRDDTLF